MNQKNNRKWMAGAFLLTAGLCFVPGKTVSARMEVNSYGELTVCTDSPVVTIRGNISSIGNDAFGNQKITRFSTQGNAYYTTINGALCSKDGTILVKCPNQKSGSFTVPSSVKKIYANAFYGCKKLTSVTIPSSVEYIGSNAFADCTNLETVRMEARVDTLREGIFDGCVALNSIRIPGTVKQIDRDAFRRCKSLTKITIPETVESLGYRAFYACERLESVSLSSKMDAIPYQAFYKCFKLKKVDGMSKIRSIDSSAFYGCERLEDITLPPSLERISRYAFSGCRRLGKVVIPKNTEKIEHYAFEEAASSFEVKAGNPSYTARGGLLLDETETSLIQAPVKGKGVVHIPDTVKKICYGALTGTEYRAIFLPASVTTVDRGWFEGCKYLETIVLPEQTEAIVGGSYYREQLKRLKQIRISDKNKNFRCQQGVIYTKDGREMVFFPSGKRGSLKLPSTCKYIRGRLDYNRLRKITVSDSNKYFKEIDGVLYNVAGTSVRAFPLAKTSYKIPTKCKSIGFLKSQKADLRCRKITVSSKNKKYYAKNGVLFDRNTDELLYYPPAKKGAYTVPKNTTKIAGDAFKQAKYLTKLTITKNVQRGYGTKYRFAGCDRLKTVEVKAGKLNYIRMNFDECSSICKLVFPSNIMTTDLRWLPAGVTIYGWENTGARDTAKAYDGKFVSRGTIPAVVAGPRVRKIVERYEFSWKRSKDASGYQIYTGDETLKNIKGTSTTKCYVKNVDDYGEIYIRAYRLVHGKKVYGKARRLS